MSMRDSPGDARIRAIPRVPPRVARCPLTPPASIGRLFAFREWRVRRLFHTRSACAHLSFGRRLIEFDACNGKGGRHFLATYVASHIQDN
ncbi:hypothetical protein [Burkholderia territorii]|uniref:hypothetical protein n=1 Tax=Burkholderia territorii TaxID=1503055 RepID=UPI0012DAE6A3|nr:hypothetical protein [Burkholderia territorii]